MMNSLTASRFVSASVIALGVLAGCSSSTTTGTGSPTSTSDAGASAVADSGHSSSVGTDSGTLTTGGSCPVDTGTDACGVCLGQKCCTQLGACKNDADCNALDACLDKCPDPATQAGQQCGDACYTAHPTGAKIADTVDACGGANCKAACGA